MTVRFKKNAEWVSATHHRVQYTTIRDFAERLIMIVHYKDKDGRNFGYPYDEILAAVLNKFPTVPTGGPHKGKPTKITYKELQNITADLNRSGRQVPFRSRRKVVKAKKNETKKK